VHDLIDHLGWDYPTYRRGGLLPDRHCNPDQCDRTLPVTAYDGRARS